MAFVTGSCHCSAVGSGQQAEDENAMLEWRIFPTSAKVLDPLEASVLSTKALSRNERDGEPQGPVSREQLFHDLIKDRRGEEIHVDDFLWT